ncbi:hypothetical protein AX16_005600 [Volvariella volvacea WC 439]|nr:hypothetical protein AX16_005600 [Volvariella volvacea WC 439]
MSGRDALEDSDEEDEDVRRDHARRRDILSHLSEFVPHPPSSPFSFSSDSEQEHETGARDRHRDNGRGARDHGNDPASDSSGMSADEDGSRYEERDASSLTVPAPAQAISRTSSQTRPNESNERERSHDRQPANAAAGSSRPGRR